jgi:hypothetical protein
MISLLNLEKPRRSHGITADDFDVQTAPIVDVGAGSATAEI